MTEFELKCPDCSGKLKDIVIIAKGGDDLYGSGSDSKVAFFASLDAKNSFWTDRIKATGRVQSKICVSCNRIFQYGVKLE